MDTDVDAYISTLEYNYPYMLVCRGRESTSYCIIVEKTVATDYTSIFFEALYSLVATYYIYNKDG